MEKKAVSAVFMVFMLAIAGATEGEEMAVTDGHGHGHHGHHHSHSHSHSHSQASFTACGAKCAKQCLGRLFPLPPVMPICFSLCMVSCKLKPSSAVYDCTHGCVHDMLTNSDKLTSNIDEKEVSSYVESCYQKCSKNV